MNRRELFRLGGIASLGAVLPGSDPTSARGRPAEPASPRASEKPADHTIRIATGLVEIDRNRAISTTTYNGEFPGPLLRFQEGRPVTIDVYNDTDTPEQLHWHGQFLPADVDGSAEEGTPFVPARGMRRIAFTPRPSGLRFYHTHTRAGSDLRAGLYGGQVGPVFIESRNEPGDYDREVFLVLKEFEPYLTRGADMAGDFLAPTGRDKALEAAGEAAMKASTDRGMPEGYDVAYRSFSINGRALGYGEPLRVRQGERVLLQVVNGSATENRSLALPGHSFRVVALDGNPVPRPAEVPVLWLGPAERVSAVVVMNRPGVWIMGDLADDDRRRGMGIVVEYAGDRGSHTRGHRPGRKPVWMRPKPSRWNYADFADPKAVALAPDETIDMTFAEQNAADHGFNVWSIGGPALAGGDMNRMPTGGEMTPAYRLHEGRRYRLRMRNASDDIHPIHLHRHSFELTSLAGRSTAGVIKDVAMVGAYQQVEVDFTADNPGLTLFHCHQQLHMDFGFMALFAYA